MSELKSCPFCGAAMEQHHKYPTEYQHAYKYGDRCPAGGTTVYIDDEPAVTAWNRRASGWRTMESAPKDGRRILLGRWDADNLGWEHIQIDIYTRRLQPARWLYWNEGGNPTHWRLLESALDD